LARRGPDGEVVWESDNLTLGHRRIAIIGLDIRGLQPMVSRTSDLVIVFNGAIYNYPEIADRLNSAAACSNRQYDSAVLLDALETWGIEILPVLNSIFAFAYYRPAQRMLILARDRFGKRPLVRTLPHRDNRNRPFARRYSLSSAAVRRHF